MTDQLSLLDYVPTSEETRQPQDWQAGDRLRGKTLSGKTVEGSFLGKSMSGMIRLQTDEPNRLNGLMLVDPSTVESADVPAPVEPKPVNQHAIAWYEGLATFYLSTTFKIMGGRLTPECKRNETARLHAMRQAALAKLKELGGD